MSETTQASLYNQVTSTALALIHFLGQREERSPRACVDGLYVTGFVQREVQVLFSVRSWAYREGVGSKVWCLEVLG